MPAGPDNPYGNGFRTVETSLTSTHQAQRVAEPFKGRVWKIKNPASLNPTSKQAVAYKLMPHAAPLLLAQPSSLISQKGHFATKNLWVTPYSEDQKWPAGEYVLQAKDCTGLKQWTKEVRRVGGGGCLTACGWLACTSWL
jgi:primary-amine oxidase